VPHEAFSIVEDVEYGIALGERGHRVHYAGEAHVFGEMVASEKASRSQRTRWEGGRLALAKKYALPLARRALAEQSPLLADLAADVLVPPLSMLVAATAAGLVASTALSVWSRRPHAGLFLFGASGAMILAYVARGWQVSGTGVRGLASLGYAPVYMAWKATLPLRGPLARRRRARGGADGEGAASASEWVRTARSGEESRASAVAPQGNQR
jgi:hypothetical protein